MMMLLNAVDAICRTATSSACESGVTCKEVINQINCICPAGRGGARCADGTY